MNDQKQKNSGRSGSALFPQGIRRRDPNGKELAPRSLRQQGKRFISDCTEKQLRKAGVWKEKYLEECKKDDK
jgi:hypothetical protein